MSLLQFRLNMLDLRDPNSTAMVRRERFGRFHLLPAGLLQVDTLLLLRGRMRGDGTTNKVGFNHHRI